MAVSRINEAGLNVNQYGNRNVIINGAMKVAQRGTSFSSVGNVYTLDRFQMYKQNTGAAFTITQSSVTDLAGFANALKVDCTTADTSLASNEQGYISYFAEGQDLQGFEKGFSTAKGFALSFYVKTNKTGLYTVTIFDRDNTRKVNGSYTVADTNWNRYTINFPADTTGKFDDNNASSLEIFFNLYAGADTNTGTLYTAWQASADAGSTTGQVNFADSTSNDWEITGIQLEVGDTATDFEHRTFDDEYRKCLRYYERWDFPDTGDYSTVLMYNESTDQARGPLNCTVYKRANPAFSATASSWGAISTGSSGTAVSISATNLKPWGCRIEITKSNSTLIDGGAAYLRCLNSGAHIALDAEL
jgi:hypothetical protein